MIEERRGIAVVTNRSALAIAPAREISGIRGTVGRHVVLFSIAPIASVKVNLGANALLDSFGRLSLDPIDQSLTVTSNRHAGFARRIISRRVLRWLLFAGASVRRRWEKGTSRESP